MTKFLRGEQTKTGNFRTIWGESALELNTQRKGKHSWRSPMTAFKFWRDKQHKFSAVRRVCAQGTIRGLRHVSSLFCNQHAPYYKMKDLVHMLVDTIPLDLSDGRGRGSHPNVWSWPSHVRGEVGSCQPTCKPPYTHSKILNWNMCHVMETIMMQVYYMQDGLT